MSDATIQGTIGGTTQFIGVPGLVGTGVKGALDYIGSSPIGSIGGGIIDFGKALDTPASALINGATDTGNILGGIGNALTGNSNKNSSNNFGTVIADYFFRAVIIILGFIFMAVGLSMFKQPTIIKETVAGVKRVKNAVKG